MLVATVAKLYTVSQKSSSFQSVVILLLSGSTYNLSLRRHAEEDRATAEASGEDRKYSSEYMIVDKHTDTLITIFGSGSE